MAIYEQHMHNYCKCFESKYSLDDLKFASNLTTTNSFLLYQLFTARFSMHDLFVCVHALRPCHYFFSQVGMSSWVEPVLSRG